MINPSINNRKWMRIWEFIFISVLLKLYYQFVLSTSLHDTVCLTKAKFFSLSSCVRVDLSFKRKGCVATECTGCSNLSNWNWSQGGITECAICYQMMSLFISAQPRQVLLGDDCENNTTTELERMSDSRWEQKQMERPDAQHTDIRLTWDSELLI